MRSAGAASNGPVVSIIWITSQIVILTNDILLSLLQLELLLTAATLCVAIVGVISGIFGMNLHNTHEDDYQAFVLARSLTLLVLVCIPSSRANQAYLGQIIDMQWAVKINDRVQTPSKFF